MKWLLAALCLSVLSHQAQAGTLVAVGDVHGDMKAAKSALVLAGVVDAETGQWTGGDTIVVQVGDQLDRGDDEQAILDWFERLRKEAEAAGGGFHALIGNHEMMNVAADLRYVTPGGFADFAEVPFDAADPRLAQVPVAMRGRVAAFLPGGTYAQILADHPVTLAVDGVLFAHGGVLPEHVAYGLERGNAETTAWMKGEGPFPAFLQGGESPVFTRQYSGSAALDQATCDKVDAVLKATGTKQMVVAHTVQREGINSACDGKVWRVDVGLAAHYGGRVQVLVIEGGQAKVLAN